LIFFDRHVLAVHSGRLMLWSVMQVTVFQDWYPSFFNTFGTGALNGSLWTIPVEIGFYALTPFLYALMRINKRPLVILIAITVASFAVQIWLTYPVLAVGDETRWMGWLALSPLPWVGMFACGMLAQRYRGLILPYLAGRFLLVLGLYCVAAALASFFPIYPILRSDGNALGMVNFAMLAVLVLSASYSNRNLADQLLRRNDVSYGIYLVHMPILNLVIHLRLSGLEALFLVTAASFGISYLSWTAIERPALSLRTHPLLIRPH
jgi:peptidoglycan/LPS O-acetylase OafA/YrhL